MLWSAKTDEFRAAAASKWRHGPKASLREPPCPPATPPPSELTSDTERSRALYCELFGWTAEQPAEGFGGYFNARKAVEAANGHGGRAPRGCRRPDRCSVQARRCERGHAGAE
jgi:hypothetical protein